MTGVFVYRNGGEVLVVAARRGWTWAKAMSLAGAVRFVAVAAGTDEEVADQPVRAALDSGGGPVVDRFGSLPYYRRKAMKRWAEPMRK